MLPQHTANSTTPIERFASLDWYDKLIEFIFRFVAKTAEALYLSMACNLSEKKMP